MLYRITEVITTILLQQLNTSCKPASCWYLRQQSASPSPSSRWSYDFSHSMPIVVRLAFSCGNIDMMRYPTMQTRRSLAFTKFELVRFLTRGSQQKILVSNSEMSTYRNDARLTTTRLDIGQLLAPPSGGLTADIAPISHKKLHLACELVIAIACTTLMKTDRECRLGEPCPQARLKSLVRITRSSLTVR